MNKNIFKGFIAAFITLNMVIMLTGIIIPCLISTDKLPLSLIIIGITSIFFLIVLVAIYLFHIIERSQK